ncbi:MAG: excinuclease ABC subunit UvrC [Desulfobacteraceae bacterium]|nr:excinuclease ABC subunit UvrC [Desulfobacteraceae bacterium]
MKDVVIHSTIATAAKEKLAAVNSEAGVYIMKDDQGKIIYVGKARDLKKRLSSYFTKVSHEDIKTRVMVSKISTIDTIITSTEKEALILESNLIKRHRPRYNVNLKDDKRYPSLRLDVSETYPNLTIARKIRKDGALYFGPYSSAQAVRQTLKFINKYFKIRKCKTSAYKNASRPCLNYQMGTCLGLCHHRVDPEAYQEVLREVILFLKGRTPELVRKIKDQMQIASNEFRYEDAAALRDRLFAMNKTLERQISVTTDFGDRDVIGIAGDPAHYLITLMGVRNGFMQGTHHYEIKETMSSPPELTGAFIQQYYSHRRLMPGEILVQYLPEDTTLIEDQLSGLKGKRVRILRPQRGEKIKLLHMAVTNADNEIGERIAAAADDRSLLDRIHRRLRLTRLPQRIECFDNSNISGKAAVSAMVVFKNNKPLKSAYRKYKIKTVEGPDDYASMAEVLNRRYGKGKKSEPLPDLVIVDGGKGQLNIAVNVMQSLNILDKFDVIGVAKKDELKGEYTDKIYKPGRLNPVNLEKDQDILLFFQRIRDEAHRFVINFHRRKRSALSMTSALDSIPGIGRQRKVMLLKHFGSLKKIQAASIEELTTLPGITEKTAITIKNVLSLSV